MFPRKIEFDLSEARRFLAAIGILFDAILFAFKPDDRRCRPRHAYGTLDEIAPQIQREIDLRHGVFFTVQDTGDVRREANLRRVRAVWAEFDQAPTADLPLESTAVVASGGPGKHHKYLAVDPSDPLTGEEAKRINRAIAIRFGADISATDNARILRLPGTWNFKPEYGDPRPVRLIEATGAIYSRRELLDAFPPVEREPQPSVEKRQWRSRGSDVDRLRSEHYLLATLDGITTQIELAPGGSQYHTLSIGLWRMAGLIASAREHHVLSQGFEEHARSGLIAAGLSMANTRPQDPWTEKQVTRELVRAFERAPAADAKTAPWSRS